MSEYERLTINRSELIAAIQWRYRGLPPEIVQAAVGRVLSEIIDALADGRRVELRGFGTFDVREREARTGRNPKTGEPVELGERRRGYWRTAKTLAEKLADQAERTKGARVPERLVVESPLPAPMMESASERAATPWPPTTG